MGLFSKLFGNKTKKETVKVKQVRERSDQPAVHDVSSQDARMNWAIKKARLTLHYFEDSLKVPRAYQQYFSIKVKIVDGDMAEHIWLTSPSFDEEGNLFGTIGNEPIDVKNVYLGQEIGIDRNLVSDWMIVEQGRLIGGYTIRAIRDSYEGAELEAFDKSLGGLLVDEGEDHFLPNFDTPEGAILSLENAYDADDIHAAIACKDFIAEAELMLEQMENLPKDENIVKQTADVLRLSFIKSLQEEGMPKFADIKRAFPHREKISDNHYIITEVCFYPDGGKSIQRLHTYRGPDGWRVLSPVAD